MIWVHAKTDAAQMIELKKIRRFTCRQGSILTFVSRPMCPACPASNGVYAVSIFSNSKLPNKARASESPIFDEVINRAKAKVMSLQILLRLSFCAPMLVRCLGSSGSFISTAAMAEAKGNFHNYPLPVGWRPAPEDSSRLTMRSMRSALADLGQQLEYIR